MCTKHTTLCLVAAMAIGATAALTSCSEHENKPDNSIVFSNITASSRYQLEETAKVYDADQDILFRDSANLILPEKIFGKDVAVLRDSIFMSAFDTIAPADEAIEAYFRSAVAELGYDFKEVPDSIPASDIDGMACVSGDIFNLSAKLLTYCVTTYTYFPGAAHGMTNTDYITYIIDDNKVMTLTDLFTPEGLEALPKLINARAKQLQAAIGPTDKITELPAQKTFYISLNDTITFVYQPYEVASYAQGAILISFYPTELTEYLTPEALKFFELI